MLKMNARGHVGAHGAGWIGWMCLGFWANFLPGVWEKYFPRSTMVSVESDECAVLLLTLHAYKRVGKFFWQIDFSSPFPNTFNYAAFFILVFIHMSYPILNLFHSEGKSNLRLSLSLEEKFVYAIRIGLDLSFNNNLKKFSFRVGSRSRDRDWYGSGELGDQAMIVRRRYRYCEPFDQMRKLDWEENPKC